MSQINAVVEKKVPGADLGPFDISDKQRDYLEFLASFIQDDKIRKKLLIKIISLSKNQASNIISCLVNNEEETITRFLL